MPGGGGNRAHVSGEKWQQWQGTHPKCTVGARLPEHGRSLPAPYLLTHSLFSHQTCGLELSLWARPVLSMPSGPTCSRQGEGDILRAHGARRAGSKPQQGEEGAFEGGALGGASWAGTWSDRPAGPGTSGSPGGLVSRGCGQRQAAIQFLLLDNHSHDHGGKRGKREAT